MHRFFVPPAWIGSEAVVFQEETARQMARVLRLRAGERVMALDGLGNETLVELSEVTPERVSGRALETKRSDAEPQTQVTLFLALAQREKFEWMLQKCTEVGAVSFVPVITRRSLVQENDRLERKAERWQSILREAAEQCGRGIIPALHAPLTFAESMRKCAQYDTNLIAWEEERTLSLRDALQGARPGAKVAVWIGPEGGFDVEEVEAGKAAGLQPVSLGKRILRMETAAIVAAVLVIDRMG